MKEKGITLIALIVTIIVLLILAGTVISMLSGDNGLLKQAARAKTETEQKSIEEQIKLAVIAAKTNTNSMLKSDDLEKELTKNLGQEGYEI